MRVLFLLPVLLFLSACAEFPKLTALEGEADQVEQASAWQQHSESIDKVDAWILTGKVGITTADESWNAQIRWRQLGEVYQIRLIAPFGQGTYQLQGNDSVFSITTPENEVYEADSPEALMERTLKWSAPVRGLAYWIRGIPWPAKPVASLLLDENARLQDMQQEDWRISVLRYLETPRGALPGKVFMHNEHYKIRLVVSKWKLRQQ